MHYISRTFDWLGSPKVWVRLGLLCIFMFIYQVSVQAGELDTQRQPMFSLAPMVSKVKPAVVNIATIDWDETEQSPLLNDPVFKRFFHLKKPLAEKTESLGTGVIFDARRGLVVTNHHVIEGAEKISVKLDDGRKLEARLIGTDPETDVAVIRIPAEDLSAIKVSDSDDLRVGDFVVAIGNPFGLGQTVTSGIVSGLGRTGLGIDGYEDFIQTDASINPGNSGGPLVNLQGELVGINTAIFSQGGGNVGIGFAIPINMVRLVTEQLIEHGDVNRGLVGLQTQNIDAGLAQIFDINQQQGVVVVDIVPNSPAENSGLLPGDVINKVNGKKVSNSSNVRNQIGLHRIGDKISFEVKRGSKKHQMMATIVESQELVRNGAILRNPRLAGATFGDIPERHLAYKRLKGVALFEIEQGGPLWRVGLRRGDIITQVNQSLVDNLGMFLEVVNSLKDQQMMFRIIRGNGDAYILIK